jgi:hypothetical protein
MFSSTGFSFVGVSKRSTRVDSEPRFARELKAIRDKRERFFFGRWLGGMARDPGGIAPPGASKWWDGVSQRVLASVSCPWPEEPDDDEDIGGVGSEPGSGSAASRSSGVLGW